MKKHLNDPQVRIIESNEDVLLYDTGHIPEAVHVDWRRDLNDQTVRGPWVQNRSCLFFCTNWVQDLKEFGLEVRRGKDRQKEL